MAGGTDITHVSGRRHSDEPDHHGINDGSGLIENPAGNNEGRNCVSRDESLTEILITRGLSEANLISSIVALGEGM